MSEPSGTDVGAPPHCYRHPNRETYVRCQRCGRPICPDCMNMASVGFQCPECVREGRVRSTRTSFGGRALATSVPVVTLVLIAVNVAVFFLVNATGGLNGSVGQHVVEIPDGTPYRLTGVAQGGYWELFTSIFTHFQVLHIAMNMIGLWIFGSFLERELGRWRYLALYLVTGLVGSVGVYVEASPHVAAFGASGSVFGLFAAAFLVLLRLRRDVTQLLVLLVLNLVISFTVRDIAWQAHIGGLISGGILGYVYAYAPRKRRGLLHAAVIVALLVACAIAVVARTASLTA